MRVYHYGWGTEQEIRFINNIGMTHSRTKDMIKKGERTKFQLLLKYKKACLRRDNWGAVNRDMVFAHLDLVLAAYANG